MGEYSIRPQSFCRLLINAFLSKLIEGTTTLMLHPKAACGVLKATKQFCVSAQLHKCGARLRRLRSHHDPSNAIRRNSRRHTIFVAYNIRRTIQLAQEGAYVKATKAIQSDGILPPSRGRECPYGKASTILSWRQNQGKFSLKHSFY